MVAIIPLLVLLVLAIGVVIVARRFRIPYSLALLVFGFALGLVGVELGITPFSSSVNALLAPGLFFNLLLPPIIFEAALHVNFRLLRRRAALILSLVFIGVVFTTLFTGFVVAYLAAIPLAAALLLAAILSPTDPIAVIDLFRRVRVPEELSTIIESESLLNDATGVVLFVVLLGVITTGGASPVAAVGQFGLLIFGGMAVGLLVAGLVYLLHRQIHDPAVETALSVVTAYGSFLLADALGASGIIACAISGIAVGTWVAPRAIDPEGRESMEVFWKVVVYVANSVIFLAMGFLFALSQMLDYLWLIAVVTVVLTVGRVAFVFAHRPLAARSGARLPNSWYNVIAISGIRGAIPVVLALSLLAAPPGLASGTLRALIAAVLGTAFLSIIIGNLVADWYVRRAFPASGVPPA